MQKLQAMCLFLIDFLHHPHPLHPGHCLNLLLIHFLHLLNHLHHGFRYGHFHRRLILYLLFLVICRYLPLIQIILL